MKKIFNYLLLTFCAFTIFTFTVSARVWPEDEIPRKSYVIGTELFTPETVLTTRHIMLAAQTIGSYDLNDMKIYYKNARGTWVDALTSDSIQAPEYFQIDYVDLENAIATYGVTFDSNGGSEVETQYISEYEHVIEPEIPTKEGYVFSGWLYDEELFDFEAYITSDIELIASWTPITYAIAFDGNGADNEETEIASIECTYDNSCTLSKNTYEKDHYTFSGWATTKDASEAKYNDEKVVSNLTTTNNSTVTLYAVWIPDEYNIIYDEESLEGATASSAIKYRYGDEVAIANPEKPGYSFDGWTSEELEITDPTKELVIPSGTIGDVTLTAHWTANTYKIIFNENSGTGTMDDLICTYDTDCTLPENTYTKTGYLLDGWAESSDGDKVYEPKENKKTGGFTTKLTHTLYACWVPEEYTITYHGLEGASASNLEKYTIEDEAITLEAPKKDYYTFTGWTGSNGDTPQTTVTIPAGSTGNLTYTANWKQTEYQITFNPNAEDVDGNMNPKDCIEGVSCTLPANGYTRTGYEFNGWATTSNGTKKYDDAAESILFETTLFAVWTPEEYTINYDLANGNASNLTISYTIETNNFILATPSRTGFTFLGWTGSNGDTPQTTVTITKGSYGNKSYTANWAINSYDIVYNKGAEDATGTMVNTACTYNVDCTLHENAFTRENYIFGGWSRTLGGAAIEDDTVNISTTESTINIYAIWIPVWEFDSTTGTITKYNGIEEDVVIPETINNVNVTKIASGAFESETMRTLELSQYITLVESNAIEKSKNPLLSKIFLTGNQMQNCPEDSEGKWRAVLGISLEDFENYSESLYGDPEEVVAAFVFNDVTFYNIDFRYTITYEGIDEDTEVSNPTIFFAFSQDFTLNNPAKDTFTGWTSEDIEIDNPLEVTIPSGTSKNLTFTATWEEDNNS